MLVVTLDCKEYAIHDRDDLETIEIKRNIAFTINKSASSQHHKRAFSR